MVIYQDMLYGKYQLDVSFSVSEQIRGYLGLVGEIINTRHATMQQYTPGLPNNENRKRKEKKNIEPQMQEKIYPSN